MENFIKENIKSLKAYTPNQNLFDIKLDANEGKNIFLKDNLQLESYLKKLEINFYPDSSARALRKAIGNYVNVQSENIIAGNGSSEAIELIFKTFVDKGEVVLSPIPCFSMYEVFSHIYSAEFIGVKSKENLSYDIDEIIRNCREKKSKVVFLCNPNNPTGAVISREEIMRILENSKAIVVIDEAYIEFSDERSAIELINSYENLIILRTLSKAFGLAGIRLGYMVSNKRIIEVINKVKSPYNLNSLSQCIGIKALEQQDVMKKYCDDVKKYRESLFNELDNLGFKVYNSQGNFLLIKSHIPDLFSKLTHKGILVRRFFEQYQDYYRISIGDYCENKSFIETLKEIVKNENR